MAFDWSGLNSAQLSTFGEPVVWSPLSGTADYDITIVASENSWTGEATNPNYIFLWAMLADVPGIGRGDLITRNATVYNIIDVDPDGGGGIRLTLEKDNS
jgi:hypothetical protein